MMYIFLLLNLALCQSYDYQHIDQAIHAEDNPNFIKDHQEENKTSNNKKAIEQYKKEKQKEAQIQEKARKKHSERLYKPNENDDLTYQKYLKEKAQEEKQQLKLEKEYQIQKDKELKNKNPNLEKNMDYIKKMPSRKNIPRKDRAFKFKNKEDSNIKKPYNPLNPDERDR